MDYSGDDRKNVCVEVGVEMDVFRGWAFLFGRGWVADVWDMWIELCWERFMESSSKEELLSVSSMTIGLVMVFSVGVGGVGWGSCMSMCWGCVGLAVVVVEQ